MAYNPDLHHRRTLRLKDYDYGGAGGYFVTICTDGRGCLFGELLAGAMRLNGFGEIVREEWLKSAEVRQEIDLDAFVVMPNHLHGIVMIRSAGVDRGENCPGAMNRPLRRSPSGPLSGSLGAMIGQFKSIVAKRINALRVTPGCPVWQRNFYEHVVRDETDLQAIREYIVNNPLQWELDENNPAKMTR